MDSAQPSRLAQPGFTARSAANLRRRFVVLSGETPALRVHLGPDVRPWWGVPRIAASPGAPPGWRERGRAATSFLSSWTKWTTAGRRSPSHRFP